MGPTCRSRQQWRRAQHTMWSSRNDLSASPRYQPGQGGKGAMAMEVIPTSRYPGDPQGQAFLAGVKGGWVVKSVGGADVQGEDFGKIMDLLDDEVADPRFSKSTA